MDSCFDCHYFEPDSAGRNSPGICHRFPPGGSNSYPSGTWWCGEFKRKEKTYQPQYTPDDIYLGAFNLVLQYQEVLAPKSIDGMGSLVGFKKWLIELRKAVL